MPNFVGLYVDLCRAGGVSPPKRIVGAVAKQISALEEEGQPSEHIELAVRLLAEQGSPPAALPAALVSAVRRVARAPLAAFLREYGWPTGARFVRGSHAGAHVYDPLGTERIPQEGWPYPRPSREEVEPLVAALTAVGAFLRREAEYELLSLAAPAPDDQLSLAVRG